MGALLDDPTRAEESRRPASAPPASAVDATRPRGGRWLLRGALAAAVLGVALGAPVWGPRALSRLAFFNVRRVEFEGVRHAATAQLLARLRVDTTTSVWMELAPLARRVEEHPLVADAVVERRLPGTLRVVVTEREPVALVVGRAGLVPYDADGRALPIEPHEGGGIDAPLVAARDTALLRLLAAVRAEAPALFARLGEARRVPGTRGAPDEFAFTVAPDAATRAVPGADAVRVRALTDITVARLADLAPVEGDLLRRRVRVAELDLRYRDQVIARLP